jgi:hypothetical protein
MANVSSILSMSSALPLSWLAMSRPQTSFGRPRLRYIHRHAHSSSQVDVYRHRHRVCLVNQVRGISSSVSRLR